MTFFVSETQRYDVIQGVGKPLLNREDSIFVQVSDSTEENIQLVHIIPSLRADHSAIKIKLYSLHECDRGRSYQLFDEDKNFVESWKKEISYFIKQAKPYRTLEVYEVRTIR